MNRAMVVPLVVPGVGQAVSGMNQFAGAIGNVNKQQVQAIRLQAQAINAQIALANANSRLIRHNAPAPGFAQRLGQAALSSRFNIGGQSGGVSPLVGQSLRAMGVSGPAAGAVGLAAGAVTLAVVALKALAEAANQGGAAIKALRDSATISGGSVQESARLRAMGLDAGSAASLRDRISTDPTAMMGAARIGVRATPSLYGSQNNANIALQIVDGLKRVRDRGGDPLRAARMIGPEAEALLPLLDMSERARKSLLGTADALAKIAQSKPASVAADLDAAWKKMGLAGDALKAALFNVFGTDMTRLISQLADGMMILATWISANADMVRNIAANISPAIAFLVKLSEFIETITGGQIKAIDPHTAAVNANTAAVNANTAMMKPNIYGGGGKAANALPSGMAGMNLNQNMQNGAIPLGHWRL